MKIVILTAKCGMGHFQCAKAIAEKLKNAQQHGQLEVEVVDIFEMKFSTGAKVFYKAYDLFVAHGKLLYNYSYTRVRRKSDGSILKWLDRMLMEEFDRVMKTIRPDVVISTYSFASELMASYKESNHINTPLITWITDVSPHEGWVNGETNKYVIADVSGKLKLIDLGVNPSKISVGGIPVSSRFYQKNKHKRQAKRQILVLGGGLGLLPRDIAFYRLLSASEHVELTVVTGKNKQLYQKLKRTCPNIKTYAYVKHMAQLMEKADVLLTKAGGITTFEAIQSEKPLIIFKPFLEQEIHNAAFISKKEIGRILPSNFKNIKEDIPIILEIINNDVLIDEMEENIKNLKETIDNDVLSAIVETERMASCS